MSWPTRSYHTTQLKEYFFFPKKKKKPKNQKTVYIKLDRTRPAHTSITDCWARYGSGSLEPILEIHTYVLWLDYLLPP